MLSYRLVIVSAVVSAAIACGGGQTPAPTSPAPNPPSNVPAGALSVSIPVGASVLGNRAYAPDEVSVAVGETVSWTNADSVAHTSTSDGSGWNSGSIAPGARFSVAFQNAGVFPYHCTIHPGMIGRVVVR